MGLTFEEVRTLVINAYPNDSWAERVARMPVKQIWAVYYRLKREDPTRLKAKKSHDFTILEVY